MKRIINVLFVIGLMLLAGCQKQEKVIQTSEWYGEPGGITYGAQGIFQGTNELNFLDSQSGTKGLICSDISCNHGKDCSAVFSDVLQMKAAVEDDHLLLVTDYQADKIGDLYLYEAALDGSDRKEIAYLGNMQNSFQYLFLEDYIVFDFWNSYDENLKPLEKDMAGIYVYNKLTGEGKAIWSIEGWNARIPGMTYKDGVVYFFSFHIDGEVNEALEQEELWSYMESHAKNQFCKLTLQDGSVEVIDENAGNFYGAVCMDDKIFCNYDFKLYVYDMETKERTLFLEEDYRPKGNTLDDKVIFLKDSEYYVYSEEKGMELLGRLENCYVTMVFPNVIYAMLSEPETYESEYVYFETKKFLKGNFDTMQYFEE